MIQPKGIFVKFTKKVNGQIFTGKVVGGDHKGSCVINCTNAKGGTQLFPPFFSSTTWVTHNQIV